VVIDEDFQTVSGKEGLPDISGETFDLERSAFMLYTSGTTYVTIKLTRRTYGLLMFLHRGRPKGVVMTHKSLTAQAKSMTECWHWSENDKVLHVVRAGSKLTTRPRISLI
jgi:acyl-CoA synthetase (AMP-forming)/AMP-acid ligase II